MNQCGRVSEVASEIPACARPKPGQIQHEGPAGVRQPLRNEVPRHASRPNAVDEQHRGGAGSPHVQRDIAVFDGDQGIRLRSAVQLKGVSVCNIGQATTSAIQIEAVANDENVLDLEPDPAGSHVDQAP